MPKGKKTCDKCGALTGPRAFVCPKCNTPFVFKAKSRETKNTKVIRDYDWRDLVKGDRIKVAGGPYYVSHGEFIPMGYRGRFVVEGLDKNGILAYGIDKCQGF